MDRGAKQSTVHGVSKSQTQLSNFHLLLLGRFNEWMRNTPLSSSSSEGAVDFTLLTLQVKMLPGIKDKTKQQILARGEGW